MLEDIDSQAGQYPSAMYRPLNDTHAIREAAFIFFPPKHIDPGLILKVGSDLQVPWRDIAPKRSDLQEMFFDPNGGQPIFNAAGRGVEYEGLKRDGSRAWRVAVTPEFVAINCLEYTGWTNIWPLVRDWLDWIARLDKEAPLTVRSIALQYINAFLWEGEPGEARAATLLTRGSPEVPAHLYKLEDPRWHLHVGRFSKSDKVKDFSGECLSRIHFNGNQTATKDGKKVEVVADVFTRVFFSETHKITGEFSEGGPMDRIFNEIHDSAKAELRTYLAKDLADRIGLNA